MDALYVIRSGDEYEPRILEKEECHTGMPAFERPLHPLILHPACCYTWRQQKEVLSTCLPASGMGDQDGLLAAAWPTLACCSDIGSKPADARSLLPLPHCCSSFQINKNEYLKWKNKGSSKKQQGRVKELGTDVSTTERQDKRRKEMTPLCRRVHPFTRSLCSEGVFLPTHLSASCQQARRGLSRSYRAAE